jgi:hypothetical protein
MIEAVPETLYRVFVAAPDDVAAERALAAGVCADIGRAFGQRVRFTFSDDSPAAADLVICILWKSLGPTLEGEFEDALNAALKRESPDILVYKKRVLIDAEQADAAAAELSALNAFWQKWFRNERGHFTASFDSFDAPDEFAEKLRRHLRQWVLRRRQDVIWPVALKGSPYRSLEPFEAEHASIFFGRRQAIRAVTAKLAAAAARGCAFLLVVGASGTGKSSLIRAGVFPWLTDHNVVPDVAAWRCATVRPAALGDDLIAGLTRALFAPGALPELASTDYGTPERFAALAGRSPEAAAVVLSGALRTLHAPRESRLLLLTDQLEELFAREPDAVDGFASLLDAFCRGGRIWVVGTLRGDRYPAFQACAGLLRLKQDGDAYDLLPPDQAEIRDIIEGPARAAGLTLEESGERSLADMLEAAARDRGALPLLQFTLHRLFLDRDQAAGTLRLAAYDRMGGLAGAIAAETETTVAALAPPLQSALPALLLALVALDEAAGAASARTVRRADLPGAAAGDLADQLVSARFLVLEGSGAAATVRLAHEALLTGWPRLAALIADHRAFLGARTRLAAEASLWRARGEDADFLLAPGRLLAAAGDLLGQHRADLDAATIDFIEASLAAEQAREAARQEAERAALQARAEAAEARARAASRLAGRTRVAAILVCLGLLAAGGTAALWLSQLLRATWQAEQAEHNYDIALKAASDEVTAVARARAGGQLPNDVATQLLEATRNIFAKLGGASQTVENLGAQAEMFNQIAQSDYLAGKFTDAQAALHQELALATGLTARDPGNSKWQVTLMQAHESLGQWSEQAGNLGDAIAQYTALRRLAERLAGAQPANMLWQNAKFLALGHLAETARATGDLPGAVAGLRAATGHFVTLAHEANAGSQIISIASLGRMTLARALLAQGDIEGALASLRAALAGYKFIADREPANHNWRFLIALAQAELGDALRISGALTQANDAFTQSQAAAQNLAASDRTNYVLRNNFAAAGRGRADVLRDQGHIDQALALYRAELATVSDLAAGDASNAFWRRNMGQLHGRVGDALFDLHDLGGAAREYAASATLASQLALLDPANTDWQRDLALAHGRRAALLAAQGDRAGAVAEARARVAILVALTAKDPTNVHWRRDLGAAQGHLAEALDAAGDHVAAHAAFAACAAVAAVRPDTDTVYNLAEGMQEKCKEK